MDENITGNESNSQKSSTITVCGLKKLLRDTVIGTKSKETSSLDHSPIFSHLGHMPDDHFNEVYPGIILGDWQLAKDIEGLRTNKITHVLNTAQGKKLNQVDTDASFYENANIQFCGVAALDVAGFKLKDHFSKTSDFIDDCLKSGGRVYVHCYQGFSRSAAVVIAYLMMKRGLQVTDAAVTIATRRCVLPNDGFLKQLCELNEQLYC